MCAETQAFPSKSANSVHNTVFRGQSIASQIMLLREGPRREEKGKVTMLWYRRRLLTLKGSTQFLFQQREQLVSGRGRHGVPAVGSMLKRPAD